MDDRFVHEVLQQLHFLQAPWKKFRKQRFVLAEDSLE